MPPSGGGGIEGNAFQNHQPIDLRGASRSKHWAGNMTRTIAHYQRLEQIGEGAYGQVYKARCKDNGQMVALKKLIIQHGGYNGMTPSVVREIKILQRLRHPRLVEMIEVVSSKGVEHLDEQDDHRTDYNHKKNDSKKDNSSKSDSRIIDAREGYKGNLFLVLEYVSHDLMALLDIRYQFSEVQVKCIFKQLLEALKYMHEQKYVHRDLKPANILIDSHHRLKLADFGLARCIEPPILDNLHDRRSSLELTNKVVTVMYRPIEILLGATRYGYSVDMWSAGCILAELVLGKTLLPGKVEMDQIQLIFDLLGSPNKTDGLNDLPLLRAGKVKIDKPKKSRLRDKYQNKMPSACLNLLEKLLELDPGKRLKANLALESRYFKSEPRAPDFPEQLPPLQLGNGEGDFHEFQTKKKRKEAKRLANAAKEEALEGGATEEEAESVFKGVYDEQMLRVQQEGMSALKTKEEVEKEEERHQRESEKSKRSRDEDRGRFRSDRASDDRQSSDRGKRRSRDRYDDEDRKRRRRDEDDSRRSDRRGDRDDRKKDESRRDERRKSSDEKRGDKRDDGRREKRRTSESRRDDRDGSRRDDRDERRQKRRDERRRSSSEKGKAEELLESKELNELDNTLTDIQAKSNGKEKRETENEKLSRDSSRRRRDRSRERDRSRDRRDRSGERKKSAHQDHDSDGHRRRDRDKDKDRDRSRESRHRNRDRDWDDRHRETQDREADRRPRDFPNAGPPPGWNGDRQGGFRDFPDGPRREPPRGPPSRDFPGGAPPPWDHPDGPRRDMDSDRRGPPPPRDFPEGPYRDREGDRRGQRPRDFPDGPPFRDREGSRRGPPPRDFPGDDRRGPDREGNRRGPPPSNREGDRRGPPPRDDDRRWNSRDSFDREGDRRGPPRDFHDRGPPPPDRHGPDMRRDENFHGPGNSNRGPPPGYRGQRFDDRPPPRREEPRREERRDRRR